VTTQVTSADVDTDRRTTWYRQMLEVRLFEDKVQELFMAGKIQGTTHLCQGQEAVSVGAVSALTDRDYMTITYRGHGNALARGMSMVAAFGELMGRTSGCCNGVGGSMHLTDFSKGLIGSFAIIGAGLPVAVGAGLSAKMRGSDAVAMSFSGDGGTNIGTFHEALNMAAVWKVPVVFVIENNLYGEYSPLRETTPLDDLAERAKSYAIPGVIVDGQDVDAVHEVASTAIARARAGDGPTLIEAKTYRYRGHSRTDPAKYRAEGELERWKARDPLDILAAKLGLSEETRKEMHTDAQAAVDAAADEAEQAPIPTFEEIKNYVYAA
jgi:TPP-dependent pyruvate/acetoin dehydrogenase alpha subunit